MAQSFSSILDKQSSEIERPKPIPVGTYLCTVVGLPEHGKSSKKETPFVRFTLKPISAEEDVDEDKLKEMGGLEGKTLRATYYDTENSGYRLVEFLEHCGIDMEGKTPRQALDETPNASVKVFVIHESGANNESIYANVGRTMLAE